MRRPLSGNRINGSVISVRYERLKQKRRSYRRKVFAQQDKFPCRRNGKEFFVGFVKERFLYLLAKGDPVMCKRNKDIKMTIFIMVAGIGLIVAGVIGIVTSRIDSREYKNSTDIRKISAVIVDFSTQDDKDDSGDVRYTTYKFKVSYVIDGKTYKGKYEERVWSSSSSYTKKYTYDKLRKGDTIDVEVYKTSKGDYKLAPEGNPVGFLLYCAAIPVGLFFVVIMICDIAKDNRKKKSENEMISKE